MLENEMCNTLNIGEWDVQHSLYWLRIWVILCMQVSEMGNIVFLGKGYG